MTTAKVFVARWKHYLKLKVFHLSCFPNYQAICRLGLIFLLDWNTPDTIAADGHYDTIKTTGNRTLKIDLGGFGERKIRVRNLELGGPIELINVGGDNGRLILYVEESISKINGNPYINYPSDNGPFNISALTLYYAGD